MRYLGFLSINVIDYIILLQHHSNHFPMWDRQPYATFHFWYNPLTYTNFINNERGACSLEL
jgi:hypothetical protein